MLSSSAATEPMLLSNLPPSRGERLFAYAIVLTSAVIFLAIVPFARLQLGPLPAFIPIYQSALIINDVITVVFILGLRQLSHVRALSFLAGAYLFTGLISVIHGLTFPGLFSPTGLLGAGPQTTAWLYMVWHGGFPLFVLCYAICAPSRTTRAMNVRMLTVVALVCALAFGAAFVATWGQRALPALVHNNQYAPLMTPVVWSVWALNLLALAMVARRKPYSELDLWLTVVLCAWLFDIALSAGLDAARYDLGFYAGRIYGLAAASFILIVMLVQNGKLYVALMASRESDRAKTEELRRLTALDSLTGIANRRAFEEGLDQEWRRTMRHHGPLSLLMIDVDYFKRFNDNYGHVAGDQCLRAVAQALAKRARRAGEMAARYGGEEFAVLLPHTDITAARRLGELMCQAVRELEIPHEGSGVAPFVTISIGVACIADLPQSTGAQARNPANDEAPSVGGAVMLVETADRALYEAKLGGRNRVIAACQDDVLAAAALPAAELRLSSAA